VKRAFELIPYAGLALILIALLVRGFRDEGLALEPFPAPPRPSLVDFAAALPTSTLAGTVVDEGGEAVAEALVLAPVNDELVWTYTDVQGHFELGRLPAGERVLEITARRFRPRTFATLAPDTALVLDIGKAIDPPPELPKITRGDLPGQLEASIDGRGWLDYEVVLLPAAPPDRFGAPVPVRAAVGADRSFHFPGLIHGEYRILVLPPWARGGSWPNLCESTHRGYVHGPSAGELLIPVAAGEIRGQLFDLEGDSLEGGLILVHPEAAPERPWIPARSDTDGGFVVRDLPPGNYQLEVQAGLALHVQRVPVRAGGISEADLPPLDVRGER
jgi:hypothetical protein